MAWPALPVTPTTEVMPIMRPKRWRIIERKAARLAELLTDMEMEVLVLHCVDEFSVREIAGTVGRSERAVDSLLHRARQKAREGLERDDD